MPYGMPNGTQIMCGGNGFPAWVYALGSTFGVQASTYPGHQEDDRAEAGYAPNPQRLNRGIDWTGPVDRMQRFAEYLLSVRNSLEQVIWENPNTGQRVGVAGGDDVTNTPYYDDPEDPDYPNHRDHVHTRQSKPIPLDPKGTAVQQIWTGDPTWLAEVLHAKRPPIRVRELPEWEQYGHGDYLDLWGVMVHHTGNSRETAESIRSGRSDLQGPLSNLHIAPDGTVSVVAAGVCWHAGAGQYPGIPTNNANYHLIGIECAWPTVHPDGSFDENERWPDAQIIAMRDTVAAILSRLGFGPERVIAHKEWAGKSQGKWDPGNLDMSWFRGEVGKSMRGEFDAPTPPPAPPAPPPPPPADPLALALVRLDRLEARVTALEARR